MSTEVAPREIESVTFAGADLTCVHDDDSGEVYVSLRRACEGLGIDYRSQRRKLKSTHWATVVIMTTEAGDGSRRNLSMVDLDTLGMWLATISPGRVSDDARPKVKRYQKECVEAIRKHFFGDDDKQPVESAENDDQPAPPLAEREVRHPDGRVVIERYDTGHVTHRSISAVSAGGPQRLDSDDESVEPDVPVDVLRRRFHGALSAALSDLDEYRRLHRNRRGEFKRRINRQLKAFVGSPREEWSALDYANAVHWLRFEHSIDIRWILRSSAAGGE